MRLTYEEFVSLLEQYQAQSPMLRHGQCVMNVLHSVRPDLYEQAVALEYDCFYSDSSAFVAETLAWVHEQLTN